MRSDTEDKDMKGYNGWSYAPYRPYFFNVGDIYVCRIAPSENAIHIEWLGEGEKETGISHSGGSRGNPGLDRS